MTGFHITVAIIGAFFLGIALTAGAVAGLVLYSGKLMERNKKYQAAREELRKAMQGRGAFTLKNIRDAVLSVPGVAFADATVQEAPTPGITIKVAFYEAGFVAAFGDFMETVSRLTPVTVAVKYEMAIVLADGDDDQVSKAVNDYKGMK